MAHDVSRELRGKHGEWSRTGAALKRMSSEAAGKAEKGELQEGHRVKYKTGSTGVVHHVDDKGTVHVVWDKGRGKPVATPAKHLERINGGTASPPAAEKEKTVREVIKPPEVTQPPPRREIVHPKSLQIAGSANRGSEGNQKMRQKVLRASTIQAQHTPELVGKTEITITKTPHGEKNTRVLASHTGQANTLHVRPEVLAGSNAERVNKSNVGGWWVKTDEHHELSDNVLIHEYGHGVHGMLISKGIIKSDRMNPKTDLPSEHAFWKGFADSLGVPQPEAQETLVTMPGAGGKVYDTRLTNRMNVGQWLFRSETKNAVEKQVSRYAGENQNEMMAELWTEYKLSSSPRAPAKYFGDWVTRRLQEEGGG